MLLRAENVVYVDESGLNRHYRRMYARAKRGVKVHAKRPGKRVKKVNVIGGLLYGKGGKKYLYQQSITYTTPERSFCFAASSDLSFCTFGYRRSGLPRACLKTRFRWICVEIICYARSANPPVHRRTEGFARRRITNNLPQRHPIWGFQTRPSSETKILAQIWQMLSTVGI